MSDLSRGCLLMAMAALGVKTSLAQVSRVGWQPILLILAETLWLGAFMLVGAWWIVGKP